METKLEIPAVLQLLYIIAVAVVLLDLFVWRVAA